MNEVKSVAGCCGAGEPTRFDIPDGGLAEKSAVLAIELAGTFIADLECGTGGIETAIEHALPGYMQPELLLILQRAHRSQRSELVVQRGYAHPSHGGQFLDT